MKNKRMSTPNQPISNQAYTSAVVIGGSMAGLLTARVLSNHFETVTILEKDPVNDFPESRKGQPQTRHGHGLLAQGLNIIEDFFPGLTEELVDGGAVSADMGEAIRWHHYGGYRRQFKSGLKGIVLSRPYLEWKIRRRVQALPNVLFLSGVKVEKLIPNSNNSRISGIQVRDRQKGSVVRALVADLFVDATGRGTRTPHWLEEMGYTAPDMEEVKVNVGYASRIYRRRDTDMLEGKMAMNLPTPPEDKRMGFLLPVENNRWIVTLGGWHGEPLPDEDRAFLRFLKMLPSRDIFNVIREAEPLSEIIHHKFPGSRRIRFEKMNKFPEGYLVVGDALASFTPVYAQGMTSAAIQAAALDELLGESLSYDGLWRPYFKQMARLIDRIWQLAVMEDFRFPETQGKKPPFTNIINRYIGRVHQTTHRDTVVYGQFLRVMNLLAPATSLFHPRILLRVMVDAFTNRKKGTGHPIQPKPVSAQIKS